MYALTFQDYVLAAVAIWLAVLTPYLVRSARLTRTKTLGASGQNLTQILTEIAREQEASLAKQQQIFEEIAKIKTLDKKNFQKYALVRFNPFEDTGGDQSFVAAILDGQNNGLVISSLHSRGGTRVYAKQVANGQSVSHKFTREEQEVVEKAARQV